MNLENDQIREELRAAVARGKVNEEYLAARLVNARCPPGEEGVGNLRDAPTSNDATVAPIGTTNLTHDPCLRFSP